MYKGTSYRDAFIVYLVRNDLKLRKPTSEGRWYMMTEELTLISLYETYVGTMSDADKLSWIELLKDSTHKRSYRVFNYGVEYNTWSEYFTNLQPMTK